jgi:hypothetical protein
MDYVRLFTVSLCLVSELKYVQTSPVTTNAKDRSSRIKIESVDKI